MEAGENGRARGVSSYIRAGHQRHTLGETAGHIDIYILRKLFEAMQALLLPGTDKIPRHIEATPDTNQHRIGDKGWCMHFEAVRELRMANENNNTRTHG